MFIVPGRTELILLPWFIVCCECAISSDISGRFVGHFIFRRTYLAVLSDISRCRTFWALRTLWAVTRLTIWTYGRERDWQTDGRLGAAIRNMVLMDGYVIIFICSYDEYLWILRLLKEKAAWRNVTVKYCQLMKIPADQPKNDDYEEN